MKIVITGAAGFIGFYLAKELLKKNYSVYGIDNFNGYYSPNLKSSFALALIKGGLEKKGRVLIAPMENENI